MPTRRSPRHGSMQFWPRKRAKREYPRVRHWPLSKVVKPLAAAGYKAGMTHVMLLDKRPNSPTKGEQIRWPVTIVECPPMVVWGARFYKKNYGGKQAVTQLIAENLRKETARKFILPKKRKTTWENLPEWEDLVLLVHTEPKKTSLGKKKPEVFEVALGGTKEEKLAFAKERVGKEIPVSDIFKNNQVVDVHGITTGKGFAGVVKRYGVAIRSHKSEKSRRAAVMGPEGYAKVKHTAPLPGKMGYHTRTIYNLPVLLVSEKQEQVNQTGGIHRYGLIKNPFVLLKGSIPGPKKRFVLMTDPIRATGAEQKLGDITYISTAPKQ